MSGFVADISEGISNMQTPTPMLMSWLFMSDTNIHPTSKTPQPAYVCIKVLLLEPGSLPSQETHNWLQGDT